ncbi:hypothetical protein G6F23_014824 [Rhizopus arrhizus]|nr:hypothetical protein G6F23_014824 [Rhizopus arrhizus]
MAGALMDDGTPLLILDVEDMLLSVQKLIEGGRLTRVDGGGAVVQARRRKRVLVVDDAVSTGQTMVSALTLLARCGAEVVGIVVAMCQGTRWRSRLVDAQGVPLPVACAFESPRLRRVAHGWAPEPGA